MSKTIIIIVLFICLAIYFLWCNYYFFDENIYITSQLDNKKYLIRRGRNKSTYFLQHSADTLAEINRRVSILITILNLLMLQMYQHLIMNVFINMI